MADYNSRAKKASQYQQRMDSNSFNDQQQQKHEKNIFAKENNNKPAAKNQATFDDIINSSPDMLVKELANAK